MTSRTDGRTRVPDLLLERYRLGEMTPDEAAAFERRLHEDDEVRQRLQALEASDEEIRRRYPPAAVAASVRQRLEARAAGAPRAAGAGFFGLRWRTVAVLAGVLAFVVVAGPPLLRPGDESTDRIKGLEPTILLFRKTPGGSERLQDGATARAGDLIRIGYRAAGQGWGVIVSVDGRGVVTQHLPRDGARAERLSSESQVLLDSAYELDDAPRWERFYFVASASPFDVAPVVAAARGVTSSGAAGPPPALPLRLAVKQSSVLLIK
jgi:anti-sigma factor RsiW